MATTATVTASTIAIIATTANATPYIVAPLLLVILILQQKQLILITIDTRAQRQCIASGKCLILIFQQLLEVKRLPEV